MRALNWDILKDKVIRAEIRQNISINYCKYKMGKDKEGDSISSDW